ncbi:hypothetical protein [Pseudomonas jessenii]|jgi:hypothetical protein
MPNTDLLPSPLFKISENQLALKAIDKNGESIKMTLAVMMTPV